MACPVPGPVLTPFRTIFLLWAVSLLGACVSYQHIPLDSAQVQIPHAYEPESEFNWDGPSPHTQVLDLGQIVENNDGVKRKASSYLARRMKTQQLDHYEVRGFEYPSSGLSGQPGNSVKVRYYRGTVPGQWPLLIILPVWGSYEYPVEKLAWRVRKRYQGKVHIAAFLGEQRLVDWAGMAAAEDTAELRRHGEISAERIRVAVVDIRRLVDWAEQQPEIDSGRIALTGFSIGAVVGSIVVTQEPRLAASTLVMGGANPADLLAQCNRIAGRTRDEVSRRLGLDTQQYQAILSSAFDELNLSRYGGRADPSRLLVVDAAEDDCMPATSREALWNSLDKPERYTIDGTHEGAMLTMTFLGNDFIGKLVVDFLAQQLDLGAPAITGAVAVEAAEAGEGDSTL